MDVAAELGRNLVGKHQIQPEYGDEQADVRIQSIISSINERMHKFSKRSLSFLTAFRLEGLSGGCRAGLTPERCSQLAAFVIQPFG